MDPVARARAIAARLAASATSSELGKRKSRWGDDDGASFGEKKKKKVYIPVDKYPDINFMGLLIGPRGSNQKRMEDESGAKILIRGKGSSKDPTGEPDEDEELHVLITADSDEAIAKAQSAVEDILFNPQHAMRLKQEQLRKVAELNGTLNENYSGNDGGHYGPGDSGNTQEMNVPRPLVGFIIGRGGETIREIQAKSGARVQIVREDPSAAMTPERAISISGTEEQIANAKRYIQNLLEERTGGGNRYGGSNPDGSDTMEVPVPNERVGLVIGRGGTTIKSIQQRTGTNITIPQTPDPRMPSMRIISITGTMDAKEAARAEILALVDDSGHGGGHGSTIYLQIPNDRVGVLIGKRGETIRGLQERYSVRIQVPQAPEPNNPTIRTISIQGPPETVQRAKEEVDMIMVQGTHGSSGGYNNQSQYGSYYGSYGASAAAYDPYSQAQQQAAYGGYTAEQYQAYYQQYYEQQGMDAASAAAAASAATAAAMAGGAAGADTSSTTTGATTGTTSTESTDDKTSKDATTSATEATEAYEAAATEATEATTAAASATATSDDPNAYWNGFYEYAAYYGIDAANAAWGVTGEAAEQSAIAFQQWQQQSAATTTTDGSEATAKSAETSTTQVG